MEIALCVLDQYLIKVGTVHLALTMLDSVVTRC
jgi:hypothetical protein